MSGINDKLDMLIIQGNLLEAQNEKILTMLEYLTNRPT